MKILFPLTWCTAKAKQRTEAHGKDEAGWLRALMLCICLFLQCFAQYGAAAETGNSDRVSVIIRHLDDKSARVRDDATTDVYNMGKEASGALPKLIAMLSTEPDLNVRNMVVRAIGNGAGQSPEAVPPLIQVLQHDRDDSVRSSAAESLGSIGMQLDLSVPALAAALADKEWGVRHSAGQALGKFGPNAIAALPVLRKLLVDADSANRFQAASTIAKIGSQAAAVTPECLAALSDESIRVRIEAAIALLSFGQHVAAAMDVLVNALSFDDDPSFAKDLRGDVRVRSAWAIGAYPQYASGAATQKLAILMSDPDGDVRKFAAASLDKVLPALVTGHRVDAIASLKETKTILQGSSVSEQKMKAVAVANAIAELEKGRGGGVGAAELSPKPSGISAAQQGAQRRGFGYECHCAGLLLGSRRATQAWCRQPCASPRRAGVSSATGDRTARRPAGASTIVLPLISARRMSFATSTRWLPVIGSPRRFANTSVSATR